MRRDDYIKLGIDPYLYAPWEDGLRLPVDQEGYECWRFDAALEGGSKLTIVFLSGTTASSTSPVVRFNLDRFGGTAIARAFQYDAEDLSAETGRCSVCVGPNRFEGDLDSYEIVIDEPDVVCKVALRKTVHSWRPGAGTWFFGEQKEHFLAWFVAAPAGEVDCELTIDGKTETLKGRGYHDHFWSDSDMAALIDHWVLSRAEIDDYTVIAGHMVSSADYGRKAMPYLMVARGDRLLCYDVSITTIEQTLTGTDPATGRMIYDRIVYRSGDDEDSHRLVFDRQRDVEPDLFGWPTGGDGLRFSGLVELQYFIDGEEVAERIASASWEQTVFVSPPVI